MSEKYVVSVIWRKDGVASVVREFHHTERITAINRAIGFAKITARAMAVGSPETHGQYTVVAGVPPDVYYDSTLDGAISALALRHNRSKV